MVIYAFVELWRTLVVVLAGGKGQRLDPLTRDRAKPAVPFGGTYRIIDFTLSNCVNSYLKKVIVLIQYRSRSLKRHILSGWHPLFNPQLGAHIETLEPQHDEYDAYLGNADAVCQNLREIREENPPVIVVLSGDQIYKMDYRNLLHFHEDRGADLTVGAVEMPLEAAAGRFGILEVNGQSRIVGFQEKPQAPRPIPGKPGICLASMGIYVFRPDFLSTLLAEDAADTGSQHDFGKDILPRAIGRGFVSAFDFVDENKKGSKYWRDVGTLDAYYEANMDLVSVNPELNLYDQEWPIRTAPLTAPPPKFVFAREQEGRVGSAVDSMISPGCIVSGGRVRSSILSPFVRINSFVEVESSILFGDVDVGRHAKIRRAIIDKGVRIPEGAQIGFDPEADRKRFSVTDQGIVLVSKQAVL